MRNLPLKFEAIMLRRGFAPVVAIIALALLALFSGTALVAWRTTLLDPYLPQIIKEFLGKSQINTDGAPTTSDGTETPSQDSETTPEDPTKDWKTYTNTELGFSFKYPKDWGVANIQSSFLVIALESEDSQANISFYKDFQGGSEGEPPQRIEEKIYYTADNYQVYTTAFYGIDGADPDWVAVDGSFYPQRPNLSFTYGFYSDSLPKGLDVLSLILSTLKFF